MKKLTTLALVTLISYFTQAQTKNFIDQPYIEVNGVADTMVTPDEIYIRIPISERDSRDKVSIGDQEQKMVAVLKELGIDTEKNLTASDMTSNFRYYLFKGKDILKTKVYSLKVSDAVLTTKVFVALEDIGIANSSVERVDHSQMELLKSKMRIKAIRDAQKTATELTSPLNQSLGSAIHITDAANIGAALQGNVAGIRVRGYGTMQSAAKEYPKIEFEKIKVNAAVEVKFILK